MTERSRDALGFADRTDLFLAVIVTHFAFADIETFNNCSDAISIRSKRRQSS